MATVVERQARLVRLTASQALVDVHLADAGGLCERERDVAVIWIGSTLPCPR